MRTRMAILRSILHPILGPRMGTEWDHNGTQNGNFERPYFHHALI